MKSSLVAIFTLDIVSNSQVCFTCLIVIFVVCETLERTVLLKILITIQALPYSLANTYETDVNKV